MDSTDCKSMVHLILNAVLFESSLIDSHFGIWIQTFCPDQLLPIGPVGRKFCLLKLKQLCCLPIWQNRDDQSDCFILAFCSLSKAGAWPKLQSHLVSRQD